MVPVIDMLRESGLLSPASIAVKSISELTDHLYGSGTYRRKAEYLHGLAFYFTRRGWTGSNDSLAHIGTEKLRSELLLLRGIGPETADCILLYVLERPVFVIDAYTRRILERHGIDSTHRPYETLQAQFHDALGEDVRVFNEYHALLVRCGKEYCRPKPRCDGCPLEFMLGGNREPAH